MFRFITLLSLVAITAFGDADFEALKAQAETGDANAQFELGTAYRTGEGVEQNLETAVQWIRKAADQDYGPAVVSMIYRYEKGEGVEQNLDEATRWYEKALELGYTRDLKEQEELSDHAAIFAEMDKKLRALPNAPGEQYAKWVTIAVITKADLLLYKEIDPWLESLESAFPDNWKILRALAIGYATAAEDYSYTFDYGDLGETESGDADERNRWLALKLFERALPLAESDAPGEKEMGSFMSDYLRVLLAIVEYDLEFLQLKTTDLPLNVVVEGDYDELLTEGRIWFERPTSPMAALNDGELVLALLGRYDLEIEGLMFPKEAQLPLAYAAHVMLISEEDPSPDAEDWKTFHHLEDDEYVEWVGGKPQPRKLPDHYVAIPKLEAMLNGAPEVIDLALSHIFTERQQLERAAVAFERAGETNRVRSLRAHQGTFDHTGPFAAGVEAKLDYEYRNGDAVTIERFKIQVGTNLLERFQAGLVDQTEQWFLGGQGLRRIDPPPPMEKVDEFIVTLSPPSDHRDATQVISLGALDAGRYLIRATMKDGNITIIPIHVLNTMIYATTIPSPDPEDPCTLFLLTNARDGAPKANEPIHVIDYAKQEAQIIEGVTDANGCYVFKKSQLAKKARSLSVWADLGGTPIVMESRDWGRKPLLPTNPPQVPFVATDRPIYRPGEEGHVFLWQGAEAAATLLNITETDSKTKLPIRGLSTEKPNAYGISTKTFDVPADARLGEYLIKANYIDKPGIGRAWARVEKYRAPKYVIKADQLKDGRIEISANYAYGAPVAGGHVSGNLRFHEHRRDPWYPTAPMDGPWGKGYWWHGDQFSDMNNGTKYHYDFVEFNAPIEGVLDANGKLIVDVPALDGGADALNTAGSFEIIARVMDASNKEHDIEEYVPNKLEKIQLCCWTERAFYEEGEEIVAHVQTTGTNKLTLTLEKLEGTNAVAVLEKTTADNVVKLDALASGVYEIKVRDAVGTESEPFRFFALGDALTELTTDNPIRLVVEKGVYDADDKATLLLQVDEPGRHIYFFDRVMMHGGYSMPQHLVMDETSKKIFLPLNGEAGEWTCFAMTIVDGKAHYADAHVYVVEDSIIAGAVDLTTDEPSYAPGGTVKLNVLSTDSTGKGKSAAVAISVYNKTLDEFVLRAENSIYNSLFSIWRQDPWGLFRLNDGWPNTTFPNAPKWVMSGSGFYRESVSFGGSDDYDGDFFGDPSQGMGKPMAADVYAISAMEQCGVPDTTVYMREDLANHAYWNAFVETDENGAATVEFPIPDTITEWKVMAWAVHTNFAASGETSFKCAKDLVVQLNTPRFMVEGDELEISASVRNHTTNTLTVIARTSLSMLSTIIKALEPGAEKMLYWTYTARKSGAEPIKVTASASGVGDGVSKPVPVLPHSMLKRGGDSGILTENNNTVRIEIDIPEAVEPESLVLDLNASPNMLETVAGALPFLAEYPHGCTEQTLNKFLPAVVVLQTLETLSLKLEDFAATMPLERQAVFDRNEIIKRAKQGIEILLAAQTGMGEWNWNLSGETVYGDSLVTTWTARGLAMAGELDELAIDSEEMIDPFISLIQETRDLAEPPWRRDQNEKFSDIDVLSAVVLRESHTVPYLKQNQLTAVSDVTLPRLGPFFMNHATEFSLYGKVLIAYYLELGDEIALRDEMIAHIEQYLEPDPNLGTYWLRVKSDQWWLWQNDEIEIMAWYLKLLNRVEPNSEKTAGVARWLLINRQHGDHWKSTRDTAICVEALCEFIVNNPTAAKSGSVEVLLNGASVELGLKPGMNTLELTSDSQHPTFFDVAWQFQTLENPIAAERCDLVGVSRTYYRINAKTDARTPLGETDILKAGETIEVELSFEAPQELEYLLATDFKPAGFENVETLSGYRHDGIRHYQEIHDERVACYINRLPKGISTIRYRLRAEHAGRVCAMPATIELMYAPKKAANSDEALLKIER